MESWGAYLFFSLKVALLLLDAHKTQGHMDCKEEFTEAILLATYRYFHQLSCLLFL